MFGVPTVASARTYSWWLWVLAGLFAFRVIAQPAAAVFETRLLPPFESWHSGLLPYPILVVTQALILAWLARTAWQFGSRRIVPSRRAGVFALLFGGLYFTFMLVRLGLGATVLREHPWFDRPLPTSFHLVLATYLLVYGHFHRYGREVRLKPDTTTREVRLKPDTTTREVRLNAGHYNLAVACHPGNAGHYGRAVTCHVGSAEECTERRRCTQDDPIHESMAAMGALSVRHGVRICDVRLAPVSGRVADPQHLPPDTQRSGCRGAARGCFSTRNELASRGARHQDRSRVHHDDPACVAAICQLLFRLHAGGAVTESRPSDRRPLATWMADLDTSDCHGSGG